MHSYRGIVLHDVINQTFARKAVDKGADGLIWSPLVRAAKPESCHLSLFVEETAVVRRPHRAFRIDRNRQRNPFS